MTEKHQEKRNPTLLMANNADNNNKLTSILLKRHLTQDPGI